MDTFLMNNRPMGPKDWGFDVAVTAAAFLFGCGQLMLTASSIVIPDLALRQYLGMVNVVPNVQVFVALAVTTLPLVVRRRFPWPVFLFCLVSFLGLQNAFNGFSLTIVGPVVALYTIASERGRAETVAAVLLAVAGLLFTDAHAATANMVLFTRFQNIVLAMRIEPIAPTSRPPRIALPKPSAPARKRRLGVWRRSACASRAKSTTSRRIRCRRSAFRRRLPSA